MEKSREKTMYKKLSEIAEGYTNANEFWKVWEEINGNTDNMKVTVVTFELVKN